MYVQFHSNTIDGFGWITREDGQNHYPTSTENGCIQDEPEKSFKTSPLREIPDVHPGDFKLTANQHVMASNIGDKELPETKCLLARLSLSACITSPTCGTLHSLYNACEDDTSTQ